MISQRGCHAGVKLIRPVWLRIALGVMLVALLPAACGDRPGDPEESGFPEVEVVIPSGATAIKIGRNSVRRVWCNTRGRSPLRPE